MATVADNLNRIKTAKASIKASIEAKGVAVPADALIDTYASKIDEIQTGGGEAKLVKLWCDHNGNYKPSSDVDGFNEVEVNVPTGGGPVRLADHPGMKLSKSTFTTFTNEDFDFAGVADMSYFFYDCPSLASIPMLDTSSVTDMAYCFNRCIGLTTIPQLDTSKVTSMSGWLSNCVGLKSIPLLDTSSVTDMDYCFQNCASLTSIPALDASKVTRMSGCLYGCRKLTDFGGFTGLKISLDLTVSNSTKITHQSLLNIINNLGQADPAFEAQPTLTLGQTNLDKLTADEIAVGTAKGWRIVA